ncbi:MAG: sterol desaturase family protein [Leptospirales bacterium]|nr:sterol desaturase family protein [Leptospirales bacterium]
MQQILSCDLSADCLATIAGFQLFMNFIRYYPVAGLVFLTLWVLGRRTFWPARIQQKWPAAERIWTEIRYSFSTLIIFASVALLSVVLSKLGIGAIYRDVERHGWLWYAVSLALLTVWHETYFYWAHRAMHHRLLFKYVHRVHHLSSNPSPFAAYAFHPLEAVLEAAYLLVFTLIVPVHFSAVLIHAAYAMLLNVAAHSGYEFYPSGWTRGVITRWFNTSTHHNMHHSRSNCNYGLYFNFWDRIMGTNHRDYDGVFEEVVARRKAGATARIKTPAEADAALP